MEDNQLFDMLTQYAQQGKDASALLADYQTLASSGKTPLGLNRWQKSDKPRMEDFNEDNRIIDEKLRELAEEKADLTLPGAVNWDSGNVQMGTVEAFDKDTITFRRPYKSRPIVITTPLNGPIATGVIGINTTEFQIRHNYSGKHWIIWVAFGELA